MGWTPEQYAAHMARRRPTAAEAAPAPYDGPEQELHEKILAECRRQRWVVFHGSMAEPTHRTAGEPDFIIAAPFGVYFVEAKSRRGKLSPAQAAMAAHLRSLGHTLHVVRSFAEFVALIQP